MPGKKFYITTTLPYVNASPHLGFALEIIQADVIARQKRLSGYDVFFNTGTDEHGLKIYEAALKEKLEPKEYCDIFAAKFKQLKEALALSYDNFIRTTDPDHIEAVKEFWQRCFENGDIYKKKYQRKYCVGCELEKTDSELVKGRCPLHPNKELQLIEEENYFFRFSKYQEKLLELYEKRPDFVLPKTKQLEIKNFVRQGLNDFSVSRLKSRLPWGIEVPGDSSQVIYVWFDALINYIATLGWPKNKEKFEAFWPGFQVAGKDNLRQQAAMWQAMLFSAKLPPSQQIFIHGFISVAGQKMSKTLGNVVDPFSLVEKYGVDALRYYLLREIPPSEDGDFTIEKFQERYNADLAKGLGNLLARVFSMIQKYRQNKIPKPDHNPNHHPLKIDQELYNQQKVWQDLASAIQNLKFNEALASLWRFLSEIDRYIDKEKPWQLFKENKTKELNWVLFGLADAIYQLSWQLYPFLPRTSLKIAKILKIQGLLKEKPCLSDKEDFIKSGLSLDFSSLENFFPRLA